MAWKDFDSVFVTLGGRAARGALGVLAAAALSALSLGCGDDQDPAGAQELWDRVHAENYRSWQRAPGFEARRDSSAPHGGASEIFLNPIMADAVAAGATTWPVGSLIVKDGYEGLESDASHDLVAAMEKREAGWYWAEWDSDSSGEALYSGNPSICTGCHESGKDFVRIWNP
jgi:hypothetical protein